MTKRQTVIVIMIILLPALIGLVMMGLHEEGSPIGRSGRKIGIVRIEGLIYSAESWVRRLRELRTDNSIAGVVLRIDSPGGAVGPSQEIHSEVRRFRDAGKPLVASMGNIGASGGYYAACPARRIFANPGTLVGSIGVVFHFSIWRELLDKIGIANEVLKAGTYKDIGSPYRRMTSRERALLQELLDDTHRQFIGHVHEARTIPLDSLRAIADGRVFTGRRSVELGLVDTLGGFADAVSYLKEQCGLPEKAPTVDKSARKNIWEYLFSPESVLRLFASHGPVMRSGPYFLYPGAY